MPSNVDVRNGYCNNKWRCLYGNDIFIIQNCRCRYSVNRPLRFVHTEWRQRQRNRCKCSHWGGINGNGNSKMQCNQMGCCCHCHCKWVPNPFYDDAIAVAVAISHHVNSPICLHRTHSWRKNIKFPLPLPSLSVNEPLEWVLMLTLGVNWALDWQIAFFCQYYTGCISCCLFVCLF